MLVRPVTTATRKAVFKLKTGNTCITHMLHCLLFEGYVPGMFHIALHTVTVLLYPLQYPRLGFTATVVIFFDTGGRFILDGSSLSLYLMRCAKPSALRLLAD